MYEAGLITVSPFKNSSKVVNHPEMLLLIFGHSINGFYLITGESAIEVRPSRKKRNIRAR